MKKITFVTVFIILAVLLLWVVINNYLTNNKVNLITSNHNPELDCRFNVMRVNSTSFDKNSLPPSGADKLNVQVIKYTDFMTKKFCYYRAVVTYEQSSGDGPTTLTVDLDGLGQTSKNLRNNKSDTSVTYKYVENVLVSDPLFGETSCVKNINVNVYGYQYKFSGNWCP